MSKTYSSEGCADAMVADGYAAEAANAIDNSVIQQQREQIALLSAALEKSYLANDDLRIALQPLARLKIPFKPQGNAGAYSLLFDDIQRAKDLLGYIK